MTTAIAGIAASVLGGLGNQSRSLAIVPRHQDTSTAGIALARDAKVAKQARKNAQEERMMALLTDPQIMGILTVFGGVYAANVIPWSENKETRALLASLAASAAVIMGLGRAGVGDMTTLLMAGGAGAATGLAVTGGDIVGDMPWYSLAGPPGMAYEIYKRIRGE